MSKIYNYEELKGIIRVGDKVRAVEGKENPCSELEGNTVKEITQVTSRNFYINDCSHSYDSDYYLELLTDGEPREGDVVTDNDGGEAKVLGIAGQMYALSFGGDHDRFRTWMSYSDMRLAGFIKTPPRMTKQEAEEKFGIQIVG